MLRWNHNRGYAIVALAFSVVEVCGQEIKFSDPRCPYDFVAHLNATKESVAAENSEFVIRIFNGQNSPDQGTGFVVDAYKGYVLTAGHVVSRAENDPEHEPIFTTSDRGEKFRLKLVKSLWSTRKIDAALLQFVDPEAARRRFTSLRGVDLALRYGTTPKGVVLGYPISTDPDTVVSPPPQEIQFTGFYKGNRYKATAVGSIFNGDSGAPAFDSNGRAFGIVVERVLGTDAYGVVLYLYTAWELLQVVFSDMTLSDFSIRVAKSLRDGGYHGTDDLEPDLRPYKMLNKDLAALALKMRFFGEEYKTSVKLLGCPVEKALTDRDLTYIEEQVVASSDYAKRVTLTAARAAAFSDSQEWDEARQAYLEMVSLGFTLDSEQIQIAGWLGSAKMALRQKNYARAEENAKVALRLAYSRNDRTAAGLSQVYLSEAARMQGHVELAKDHARIAIVQAPVLAVKVPNPAAAASGLLNRAAVMQLELHVHDVMLGAGVHF